MNIVKVLRLDMVKEDPFEFLQVNYYFMLLRVSEMEAFFQIIQKIDHVETDANIIVLT